MTRTNKVRLFQVLPREKFRLDLFIQRTMGAFTEKNRLAILFFNPHLDPVNIDEGTWIKVPTQATIDAIKTWRNYVVLSYM